MKWRDTLRMPVSEAARVGAKQMARLLQTDVRALFAGRAKATDDAPAPTTNVPRESATSAIRALTTTAQLAVAVHHPPEEHAVPQPEEKKAWWNPGEVALGLYRIDRVLASSGRFRVYLGQHLQWNVPLVLKAPVDALLPDKNALESITLAASKWTQCGLHPHVAYCFTTHRVGRLPVVVIEYVDGGSLRQWMASGRTQLLRVQLDLAIQICHALEHTHSRGVTHGALTPENILLTSNGTVRVTDFGIAARRDSHTEAYTAPERWVDESPSDIASDVFALGVCLFELFCNGRPYEVTRGPRRRCAEPKTVAGDPLPDSLTQLLQASVDWEPLRRPRAVAELRHVFCDLRERLFRSPSPFASLPANTWDADGWNNQGVVALASGQHEEATLAFEAALAVDARHLQANFNLGVLQWRSGQGSDDAILAALGQSRAPQSQPGLPTYLSAFVALESGNGEKALELLREISASEAADAPDTEELVRLARRHRATRSVTRELRGHAQPVAAVALSADGKWLLSGGDDHALLLWDTFAGTPVRCLDGHSHNITSLAMTPNGEYALSGSEDGTVKLWDLSRGRCLKTLQLPGKVFALCLSADARLAVTSSAGSDNFLGIDGTLVKLWDLEKERVLRPLEGHSSAVKALALSSDGKRLVTGGDDQQVVLWDLLRGPPLRVFRGHEHFVSCVACGVDGQIVLSGSWDRSVRIWDVRKGHCLATLHGHKGIVTCLAISEDGSAAVSGSWDGTVRVWDLQRHRCLRTFTGHSGMVTSVAVATTARLIASGSWDASVRLWDLPQPGPEVCTPQLSSRSEYACLPPPEPTTEERIELAWNALRAGKTQASVESFLRLTHDLPLTDPSLGNLFAALRPHLRLDGARSTTARLVHTASSPVMAAAYDPSAQRWCIVDRAGGAWIADRSWPQPPSSALQVSTAPLCTVAIPSQPDAYVAGGLDRAVYLFPRGCTGDVVRLLGHRSIVSAVIAVADGTVASGSYDHTVRLWDVRERACRHVLQGHERQVTALAAHPSGQWLASADYGGTIGVWDVQRGELVSCWQASPGRIRCLRFLATGEQLVFAADDGVIRVWETATGSCLAELFGHHGPATQLVPSWDPAWVSSAGNDGTVRLWNWQHPERSTVLYRGTDPITALASTHDSSSMLIADAAGRVFLLPVVWAVGARNDAAPTLV